MARGVQLIQLVTRLRAECGQSVDVAVNADNLAQMKQILARTQEVLKDAYDWPFMYAERDKTLAAGQRYYGFPSDMGLENVDWVEAQWNTRWYPLEGGITGVDYNFKDSDTDQRSDPILKWGVIDTGAGEQWEAWPIPQSNGGLVRLHGKRTLKPLIADSDVADLDDILIIMSAAAEILSRDKMADSKAKLAIFNQRLGQLRARTKPARTKPVIFGGQEDRLASNQDNLRARYVPSV